jgi:hypothetical protein
VIAGNAGNERQRRLEGSRFGSQPKDLALFFSARVWPQTSLNRRLPRTTQRVVCLLVRERNYSNRPLGKTSRWVIPGSRLFNLKFGLLCRGKNIRGPLPRGKAAPLQWSFPAFPLVLEYPLHIRELEMKELKTALLLLMVAIANSTVADPAATEDLSIVPGSSMAGVSLGPNGLQELKKLGKPYRVDRGMSQTRQVWKWSRPEGRLDTFFIHTVSNGVINAKPADGVTIDLIRSTVARFKTSGGIGVGSTLDQIRKSFPNVAPVNGTPTIFDDLKQGIAFEFSAAPIGHSVCIAVMVHPSGQIKIATQEQVAEVLEKGSQE